MKKLLLVGIFFIVCSNLFAVTYYSVSSGSWSDNSIWSTTRNGAGGAGVPTTGDVAVIDGHNVILDGDVTIATLIIRGDVADGLQYGGSFLDPLTTLTITSYLGSVNSSLSFATTTAQVIENNADLQILLSGTGTVLRSWGYTSGFANLLISTSGSSSSNTGFSVLQNFTVSSGTFSPVGQIRDASGASTITVESGATLSLDNGDAINGDGSTTSRFNEVVVNGTVTQQAGTTNYINSNIFTLGSTGTLNINYYGSNQTQGWWHTTTEPTTVNIDVASTVNYAANADQNIGARAYGNLVLGAGATAVSKTISGLGNFIVKGDFNLASSSITFSSTNTSTNLDFQGDITNEANWGSFSNTNIRFTGSSAQLISGGSPLSIPINLVTNNTSGVTFSTGVNFTGTTTISGTGTGSLTFDDITIAASSSLTPPSTLTLTGDFANNGTYNSGTTTVVFSGTSNITGTATFYSVNAQGTITNNGDITLGNSMTFSGSANVDFDGAGSGIFLVPSNSDASTTARIGNTNGASVSGQINVQRYMSGERIWRYMTAPGQNVTVSEWQSADFPITGSFDGAGPSGTVDGQAVDVNAPSMYYYDEQVAGNLSEGWVEYPVSANTETIVPGEGYAIYQRKSSAPVTLLSRGDIISGLFTFPTVTYTNGGSGDPLANDGWNLVGNPYPSPIDWASSTGWTKTGLTGVAYVKDNGASGDFYEHTGPGGSGTGGWNGHIAMYQGFWVQATSSPTFRVDEGAKVADAVFYRTSEPQNLFRIFMTKDSIYKDDILVHFTPEGDTAYQESLDALKMEGDKINFSFITSDQKPVAINALPEIECTSTVPMLFNPKNPTGTYKWRFDGWDSFTKDVNVQLIDAYTDQVIDLSASTIYEFTRDDNPASYGSDRFALVFSTKEIDVTNPSVEAPAICVGEAGSVSISNAQAGVTYSVEIDGQSVSSTTAEGAELDINVPVEYLSASVDVVVKASNGCHTDVTLPGSYQLVVNDLPEKPTTVDGSTCGEGVVTLQASGANNGEFRWYTSNAESAQPIEGAVNSEFETSELMKSKEYFVSIVNGSGCESERQVVKATVKELPQPEVTQVDEFTLVSNYTEGNQWYFNNELIPGATGNELDITQSGTYSLEVTLNGCTARTDTTFAITAMDEKLSEFGIEVYPNPVEDVLSINTGSLSNPHLQITSISGRVKYVQNLREGTNQVNVSKLEKGLYLIKIRGRNNQFVLRLIKK